MRFLIIALLAICVTGCANGPKSKYFVLSTDDAAALRGRPVTLHVAEDVAFKHYTAADQATMSAGILFGAIGGGLSVMIAEGNASRRGKAATEAHGLRTMTPEYVARLRALLETRLGVTWVEGDGFPVYVKPEAWTLRGGTIYYAITTTFGADKPKRARAFAQCRYTTPEVAAAESDDAMLADGARRLKDESKAALDHCADALAAEVFIDDTTPAASAAVD